MKIFNNIKQFLIKHNLFDFKTRNHKLALFAMVTNFGAAAFKIIAAFYISSYFLIVSSFYSVGIGIATQLFFRGVNRSNLIPAKEKKYVILMYATLLVSSIIYAFYMVRQFYIEVPVFNYGRVLSLGIAIVSFTELAVAIRGLIKSYYLKDSLLTARKVVTLVNALVAIVVTQSAIITYVIDDGTATLNYNAILGLIMGVIAILISIIMLIRQIKSNDKPLEQMTLEEMWELFPVYLVPHKNAWTRRFAKEKRYIFSHMTRKNVKQIEHIGSTAINDIQAKNIIDMLIVIDGRKNMKDVALLMKRLGYRIMNESKNRMTLNKGYTMHGFAKDVYHVHLRYKGDCDEVYFRDYLNNHPDLAKEYEVLKLELADIHKYNRDAYKNAKSEFVNEVMGKALLTQKNNHHNC